MHLGPKLTIKIRILWTTNENSLAIKFTNIWLIRRMINSLFYEKIHILIVIINIGLSAMSFFLLFCGNLLLAVDSSIVTN